MVLGGHCFKDSMDKKFGAPWNCVIGQYYSFEITAEVGRCRLTPGFRS